MNIAVIGAGFTGLSAAFQLLKKGHKVSVFEKDSFPGGLAIGFKAKEWTYSLEKHYHHWFTNDDSVLNLVKEINQQVLIKRPKTSVYIDNHIYQFDSVSNLLTFPVLSLFDRLRMGATLAVLRYNPFWKPLEKIKASELLPKMMGEKPYRKIWEPLLVSKFGTYSTEISLVWFWARIKKRTPSLAYPKGGFLEFANALVRKIEEMGGRVLFNTEVKEIINGKEVQVKLKRMSLNRHSGERSDSRISNNGERFWTAACHAGIAGRSQNDEKYDKVVVTLPSFFFIKIAPQLPQDYKNKLMQLKGLGAANLILRLKKPFLQDGTYWLNICDTKSPIMAIVEHTNFMDKKYYNNEHIVYLGNYLPHDHPYMKMNAEELLKIYDPFLKKINPTYNLQLIAYNLFTVPFAQPIIPLNYSKIIPPFETPLKNVYLANIQQVYPWDRGTNYAIELGEKVAKLIIEDK